MTPDYEDFPGWDGRIRVAADGRGAEGGQVWVAFEESEEDEGDDAEAVTFAMPPEDALRLAEFLTRKAREAILADLGVRPRSPGEAR